MKSESGLMPWCSGHPLPDGAEGEESDEEWDEADDNGSRKICEVCNKPQTYGARHRRRRRALLPAEVQEQPEAATAPARIAVAPEHDCLHEAITNIAESGSASVSGFATPLSGVSLSAAQHINFAFSVDFETQKDVSVEAGSATVSSQPKLDTIPERVEHFHVDNITLHPEVVVEEEESGEPVSFPTELMGDHVHIHAEETEPCPCPQALDTFQACLDVIHNMEVIMTLHYLDDQNKMHTETVYGVPAHPAPHVHHPQSAEPLVQEEDADNTASPNSTSAPVLPHLEENTWDSAIQHSAAVRHELMEIIEEKILQPELEVEERRRARCHHRPAEEGGVGHFSLQVGGSLGSENLASMMNSLNTTFSTSSMDRASQSSGANPHLIKSVSDASALAKKLQALKQSQSPQDEGLHETEKKDEEKDRNAVRVILR
nr:hypothetical protein BaRGS_022382 [Batillaria attramentaria]